MQISVINVTNQTVPTSKGSYQALEVTYKEVQGGKTGTRKIMSFVKESKAAFDSLVDAKYGDVFDVKMVKDAQDKYWVWTDAKKGTANAQGNSAVADTGAKTTGTVAKGSWETAEERAARQVYIIRQSSLSTAASVLSVGTKSTPEADAVIALAKQFEDYVFGRAGITDEPTKDLMLETGEFNDEIPF